MTLIELTVTLAVAGVLLGMGSAGLQDMVARRAVSGALDGLTSDFRYARSEAVKRVAPVTICRSLDQSSCAAGRGDWRGGWIVFVDGGARGSRDADDEVLRVQGAWHGVASIGGINLANTVRYASFEPTGRTQTPANQSFVFTPHKGPPQAIRLLCVSAQGRPGVRPPGTQPPC